MRIRAVPTLFLAVLSAGVLALPASAGAGTSDMTLALTPATAGRLSLHWAAVGAPLTGTTTLTVVLPSSMTTSGGRFADTCSPFSPCQSASESLSPDGHTLTFKYVGTVSPEGDGSYLDLTILYSPGVELSELPLGTITASVSNSTDANASNQASLQVGGGSTKGSEGGSKEGSEGGSTKSGGSSEGGGSKKGSKGGGSKGSESGSKEENSGGGHTEKEEGESKEGKHGGSRGGHR